MLLGRPSYLSRSKVAPLCTNQQPEPSLIRPIDLRVDILEIWVTFG